ncbi:hypothetical protein, partial [Bariatricus sp. HCP28S3_D3]|uniref:hypothetical protein n=1 Tax=Bariatricus sp. HCP28S3_D3 TaxID=3438901 RepID=UPI003F8BD4E2
NMAFLHDTCSAFTYLIMWASFSRGWHMANVKKIILTAFGMIGGATRNRIKSVSKFRPISCINIKV